MWFLEQMSTTGPINNILIPVLLEGSLNKKALVESINEVVRRHEALRNVFRTNEEQHLVQVVKPYEPFEVTVVPLADEDTSAGTPTVRSLLLDESRNPFSLSEGPLFRFSSLSAPRLNMCWSFACTTW